MAVLDLAQVTWEEVRDLDRAKAVAILPVGAVEAHGPHLPLATDVIIAETMARAAAARLATHGYDAVLLPPLTYTAAEFAAGFPGTVSVRPGTVTALLLDLARSLTRHGLHVLAVANAHLDPALVAPSQPPLTQHGDPRGPDELRGGGWPPGVLWVASRRRGRRGRAHDRDSRNDPRRGGARGASRVTLSGRGAVVTGAGRGIGMA